MTLKDMVCKNSYDLYKYLKEELDNVNEDYEEVLKDRKVIKKFLFFKTVHYKESGVINNPKSIYMKHKKGEYGQHFLYIQDYTDIHFYKNELEDLIKKVNKDYVIEGNTFSSYSFEIMREFILLYKLVESDNLNKDISDMILKGDK